MKLTADSWVAQTETTRKTLMMRMRTRIWSLTLMTLVGNQTHCCNTGINSIKLVKMTMTTMMKMIKTIKTQQLFMTMIMMKQWLIINNNNTAVAIAHITITLFTVQLKRSRLKLTNSRQHSTCIMGMLTILTGKLMFRLILMLCCKTTNEHQ